METPQDQTVAERMRAGFEALTRAERQLANAMLASYPMLGLDSITAVASASGVSTPTVVRMAKKLGFTGFPEMQAALRGELEATLSGPIAKHDQWRNRWAYDAPESHILNRFAEQVSDNLRRTLCQLSPETFDATVALFSDRRRAIHIAGGRITRTLADYLFTHMQMVRAGVTLIAAGANAWPHYMLDIREGDVVVVFDVRRYQQDLLRLAEAASDRRAKIVLFTDQWGSPVASHATHAFHARIEAPSAWDSSVVTLFVMEALIAAMQDADWTETQKRMETLDELFDRTRLFRKFV